VVSEAEPSAVPFASKNESGFSSWWTGTTFLACISLEESERIAN
jgi:hypothetical protein